MYCNECGKKINVGEKFCGKCGAMTKDTDVNINTTAKNPITRPDVNNILKKQSISFNIPQKKQLFLLIGGLLLALIIIIVAISSQGFSPVGRWECVDEDLEIEFYKDKTMYWRYESGSPNDVMWEKEKNNLIKITIEGYEVYADYDKKSKILTIRGDGPVYKMTRKK